MKYNKIDNYAANNDNPLVQGENILYQVKPKKSAFIINQILYEFLIFH